MEENERMGLLFMVGLEDMCIDVGIFAFWGEGRVRLKVKVGVGWWVELRLAFGVERDG